MQTFPHAAPVATHPDTRQPDAEDGFSLSGPEEGEVEEKRPPRAAVLPCCTRSSAARANRS